MTIVGTNKFIHPNCNHSGNIIRANGNYPLIQSGDAFVIGPGSDIQVGVIRTRDCVPVLGIVDDIDIPFGIHISNITELGWGQPSTDFVPISKRVLHHILREELGANLDNCKINIGPCIAGLIGDICDCYGYTEKTNFYHGTRLIRLIQLHHPNVDLEHLFFRRDDSDKIYFRWGEIMVRIFQSLGIKPENINTSYNYCTRCNYNKWWSTRYLQNSPDPELNQLLNDVGPSNLSWISKS